MKKIILLFLCFITVYWSNAQCTTFAGGVWPNEIIALQNDGTAETIATDNWPNGEVSLIEGLIVGNTYTITGTNTTSIYITVTETPSDFSEIGNVIGYGTSTVNFTATTSEILVFWHLNTFCATQAADDTLTIIQCTSPSCTCTASSSPDMVTSAVTPANGATDVEIIYGSINTVGPFEWTVPISGEPATRFKFSLGTNPAGDNIGTINNFSNGETITYDWLPNTTYYWFVESVNCAGSTPSSVFSFTTSACTETSAPIAASVPSPANSATNVPLSSPENGLALTWTAGSPSDNFTVNIGTTPLANDVSFDNFQSGEILIGLSENTTYYWSVDAVNCFGTTNGPVWSFTTGTALSVADEEIDLLDVLKVYPNPTSGILNIKTNMKIDQIKVFNLIGQNIAFYNSENLSSNEIDVSALTAGIYILRVKSDKKEQSIRFIKK